MKESTFVDLLLDLRTAELRAIETPSGPIENRLRAIAGEVINDRGSVAEWLWVKDITGVERIGLAFVDFYTDSRDIERKLSQASILKKIDGGFLFPGTHDGDFELDVGPYLPVHCYEDSEGPRFFLVPDAADVSDPVLTILGALSIRSPD